MIVKIMAKEDKKWKVLCVGEFKGNMRYVNGLLYIEPEGKVGGAIEIKEIKEEEEKEEKGK